jgi:MFS family permease
MSELFTGIAS